MTIESFFIGTRMSGKRYGPQSKDMQVSEFIALISPKNEPEICPTRFLRSGTSD